MSKPSRFLQNCTYGQVSTVRGIVKKVKVPTMLVETKSNIDVELEKIKAEMVQEKQKTITNVPPKPVVENRVQTPPKPPVVNQAPIPPKPVVNKPAPMPPKPANTSVPKPPPQPAQIKRPPPPPMPKK